MTDSVVQPSVAPITASQRRALTDAERAASRLAFAPKLAVLNGAGMLLGAAVSLAMAVGDPWLLVSAAVLAASGFFELASGRRLRDYQLDAPLRLALNQIVLLVLVIAYSALQLRAAMTGELSLLSELAKYPELASFIESASDPQLRTAIDDMSSWLRTGLIVAYIALIAVSVILQGGAALYYWSRRKHLEALLSSTPDWVLELLRARSAASRQDPVP